MINANPNSGLAVRFAEQLRDKAFRVWLARSGYISGQEITIVSEGTVIDQEVLRRTGKQLVQEAPGSEFGWRLLP